MIYLMRYRALSLMLIGLVCPMITTVAVSDSLTDVDSHAPIGVMGDHTHKKGEWMFSYRYGTMHMDGNRDGSSRRSLQEVWSEPFGVTPIEMDMDMHMFGTMYGYNDSFTFMAMLPYIRKTMDHGVCPPPFRMANTGAGRPPLAGCPAAEFTTRTQGIGDAKLMLMWSLYNHEVSPRDRSALQVNMGMSFPTGSIDEKDDTPMGRVRLPYPMQLGSGTYDPVLSATWTRFYNAWSWGGTMSGMFRTGRNSKGYRLGHRYGASAWLAHKFGNNLSLSFRLDGHSWRDIEGRDKKLNPALIPTARTDLRGGARVDMLAGVNWMWRSGMLENHRLALEFGRPVYQHLDGPQLEVDHRLIAGWQYSF